MSSDSELESCYRSLVTAAEKLIRGNKSLRHRTDEAGDLVNEVLTDLLEKYGQKMGYEPLKGTLGAYLNGCVREHWRRTAKRSWRKSLRREVPTDPLPALADQRTPDTEFGSWQRELLKDVEIDPLLIAHHVHGHSWPDIADAINREPAAVRQQASRAARKLRKTVTPRQMDADSK